jgi:hypothetical protein
MTYLVAELINQAYYLSSIVARDLETVTGGQQSDGLRLLNAFLAMRSADQNFVPYYEQHSFTAVTGQETYFIENLIQLDTFTFNIGPVRYSMVPMRRKMYFGNSRVDNINSLPFNWHWERVKGGSNLYVYFNPASNYPMKIWGKFGLEAVALDDDLEETYDAFYIEYMRYELASYICDSYAIQFPPQNQARLERYRKKLNNIMPPDLTMRKISSLGKQNTADYYAQAAFGPWVP